VAFSPDGKRLVSPSFDKTMKVWDLESGQAIQTFEVRTDQVKSLAFSPDSKRLVMASKDEKVIRLWDTVNGKEIQPLKGHKYYIDSVAFSPDGKRVASAGSTFLGPGYLGEVKLWDTASLQQVLPLTLKGHTAPVRSVAFSPDGKLLASGAGAFGPFRGFRKGKETKGNLILWDAATGREVQTIKINGRGGQVKSVAFSPDGKLVASGSWNFAGGPPGRDRSEDLKEWGAIKLWDTGTGKGIRTFKWRTAGVNSLAFSPDGKHLAATDYNLKSEFKLWEVATGQEVRTFKGHTLPVVSVVFSPDGKLLASSSTKKADTGLTKGEVRLWDPYSDKEDRLIDASTGVVGRLAFSPDGKRLAGALDDKTVKVWDVDSRQAILTLKGHTGGVGSVAFSPNGERIASSGDNTVRLWDARSGLEVLTLKGGSGSLAFSPDGKRLASASGDTIIIWDASKSMNEPPPK